jgi:hypothetical protein
MAAPKACFSWYFSMKLNRYGLDFQYSEGS